MIKLAFISITSLLLLAACSSVSVTSDYDPGVDFAGYNTYDIYNGVIKDSELENAPLIKKRVLEAIVSEMQKKGYTRDESGNAQLMIYASAGTAEKMNVTDYGYGYGGWWGPYPYGRDIDVSYYTQASLIIDLVDHSKKEMVWRGIGTGVVDQSGTPEERQERIDNAVAKILDQYPPIKE